MAPEPDLEEFAILVRRTGLPLDGTDLSSLRDGYIKMQRLVGALNRPQDMTTEPPLIFRVDPEQ